MRQVWMAAIVGLAVAALGCGQRVPRTTLIVRGGPTPLRTIDLAARAFEKTHPGIAVITDFSCPPCLLPSHVNGDTQVDALISVGDTDIGHLQRAGLLDPGQRAVFGEARLALVAPKRGRATLRGLGDLHSDAVHSIGVSDPEQTDLGQLTVAALRKAGIYNEVASKLEVAKSGCDLLKSVALVVYDAAIVYDFCVALDASSAERVEVLTTRLYDPVPMIAVANKRSASAAEAQAFVEFLASDAARRSLEARGVRAPTAQ